MEFPRCRDKGAVGSRDGIVLEGLGLQDHSVTGVKTAAHRRAGIYHVTDRIAIEGFPPNLHVLFVTCIVGCIFCCC